MYERAAELYILDNLGTQGNTLLVKSCDLRIMSRDYTTGLPIAIKVGFVYFHLLLCRTMTR